ncbi:MULTISPECIES: hypothetical protein [unclassified Nocardioides]|uniref:hypothetical protein n=1 Tax=unclassified Nocardioides TaxID=2615069 RepID=UPI000AE1083F|nr:MULTISPECIES: hypothetical protein [unclassified Nocardioides]
MPRLTNPDYLNQRQQLMRLYRDDQGAFSHLPLQAQHDLHVFFQTTNLGTDAELLEERARHTAEDPSLPQRAGRAFTALDMTRRVRPPTRVPSSSRRIYVRGVMRPDPDATQLARALLKLADEPNRSDTEDRAA